MSSTTDLSNLTTWVEERITALYKATTHGEFEDAFDELVASDVQVVFNGKPITRHEYKQQLELEHHEGQTVEVTFDNSVSALDTPESNESGVVGVFYRVKYTWPAIGPTGLRVVISSLNITVKEERTLPPPDKRRVFELNQVHSDVAIPRA